MRFLKLGGVSALVAGAVSSAHAELPTAVTGAITSAQTDMLALFSALTVAGAAIWVARLIYKRFSVK